MNPTRRTVLPDGTQGERTARFEVRAVGELYTSSAPVAVSHTW
ncbi:hypothetical protein [Streptomyces sp. GESEQ-35]|nr:hypothetical protein [Streptomyces sp. GESEQ-35]